VVESKKIKALLKRVKDLDDRVVKVLKEIEWLETKLREA